MKINKELLLVYIFSSLAILLGLIIIIFGEVGRGIGESIYVFKGAERLYGFYPIAIGIFFIWAFRLKYNLNNKKDK
jgi:hypothetical protein